MPPNWKWVTLNDIGIVVGGGTPSTKDPEFWNGNIPWVTPADLSNYEDIYISKGQRDISQVGLEYSSANLLPENSIIFSTRAPIGYVAITKSKLATNQGFKNLILPNDLINPKYVFYYLKTIKELAENMASGTTFLELSASKFREIPFPLAPIEEQNRIVEKIEEVFSELDKNIYQLKNSKRKSEFSKIKILDKLFNGGFKEEKLSNLTVSIEYGYTAKSFLEKKKANNIHYLRITDIQNGQIDWHNVPFCEADENIIKKYLIKSDDILFARSGNTVGKTILINNPPSSLFASYLIRIRVNKMFLLPKFLYYYYQSNHYWKLINKGITGIGQPNFNGTKLSNLYIPVPSLSDQKLIIDEIEERFLELNNLKSELEINISKTILLKSKILKDAFQGRISKQLQSDFTVEILLSEIRKILELDLKVQQEVNKNRPKLKRMEKEKLSIIQVLEKYKQPISSKQLWEDSMYSDDIEKFYAELKKVQHFIKQEKTKSTILISLI